MESTLPSDLARERKSEILSTFARMVRLAAEDGISAILISGDLFDSDHITRRTQQYVIDLIASHPDLRFFYLAGNHDRGALLKQMQDPPSNLCTFDDGWRSYDLGEVCITGSERPNAETLSLDANKLNIVMLHGQERSGKGAYREDTIRFGHLKKKHIDYVALGHLHEYRTAQIDDRCTACYCGCLEGRGFDECGQKGYVLLETESGHIRHRFIPFAKRQLHTVPCDITDCRSPLELETRLLKATQGIPATDLVKAVLTGECAADTPKDLLHLRQVLSERFYFAKISDESRLRIRDEDWSVDVSLRGEFVRRVLASHLSEAEKERIIACGLRVLMGEEAGL